MKILAQKRCIIGEGPIWNEREGLLYFVNAGGGKEICAYDPQSGELTVYPQEVGVSAIAFAKDGRMLVTRPDGAFFLDCVSGNITPLYDTSRYRLQYCNDAKVGPDGRFYVGTQSEWRQKRSDRVDGKLWRIDPDGTVTLLLDGLILSNGMDWSPDERVFYHVESGTHTIREFEFDKQTGSIRPTGRSLFLKGADGMTVTQTGELMVACWGQSRVAVVNPHSMTCREELCLPTTAPASCCFFGERMNTLAITTASYHRDLEKDPNAGYLYSQKTNQKGRLPYLFG